MTYCSPLRRKALVFALVGGVALPAAVFADSFSSDAAAVVSTVSGSTTRLAHSGSASNVSSTFSSASQPTGTIPSLGSADALSSDAVCTVASSRQPDEATSQASVSHLVLNVKGHVLSADFVLSQVWTPAGGPAHPSATVRGLTYDGDALPVTGQQNQVITGDGMQLVIDEVQASGSATRVNALHLTAQDGSFDVVVASAAAGVSADSAGGGSSGGSSSGGLLGGVTSTLGGVVNTTTSTLGHVLGL